MRILSCVRQAFDDFNTLLPSWYSKERNKKEPEDTRTKHSSDSLPVHQTLTCNVFVYSLLSGTAIGNVSPKVGLRRSTTGFVQHMWLTGGCIGSNAAFMYLKRKQGKKQLLLFDIFNLHPNRLVNVTLNIAYIYVSLKTFLVCKMSLHLHKDTLRSKNYILILYSYSG